MKILVVYDSVFGNTETIAEKIGAALEHSGSVRVLRANATTLPALDGVELLLVGSPTRGFRATQGVMHLLRGLPPGRLNGVRAAAFDTRIDPSTIRSPLLRTVVKGGGYAAPRIARLLDRAGATRAAEPMGFIVDESEGPLRTGEVARAEEWARTLTGPE